MASQYCGNAAILLVKTKPIRLKQSLNTAIGIDLDIKLCMTEKVKNDIPYLFE